MKEIFRKIQKIKCWFQLYLNIEQRNNLLTCDYRINENSHPIRLRNFWYHRTAQPHEHTRSSTRTPIPSQGIPHTALGSQIEKRLQQMYVSKYAQEK